MRKFSLFFLSLALLCTGAAPLLAAPDGSEPEGFQLAAASAVAWRPYDKGLALAKQQKKHAFVQFNASWCGYCRKMDGDLQKDKRLSQILNKHFVPIRITEDSQTQISFEGRTRTEDSLIGEFQVSGYPTLMFVKPDGEMLATLPGYLEPDDLYGMLLYVSSKAYEKMPYEQFQTKHLPKYL